MRRPTDQDVILAAMLMKAQQHLKAVVDVRCWCGDALLALPDSQSDVAEPLRIIAIHCFKQEDAFKRLVEKLHPIVLETLKVPEA